MSTSSHDAPYIPGGLPVPGGRRLAAPLIGCAVWGITFVAGYQQVLNGHIEPIPYEAYTEGAQHWLAHQPLYETQTIDGFQYFPQAAMLFAPFELLGGQAAALGWRALWWVLYGLGIWRAAGLYGGERQGRAFLITTCLAMGTAIGSLTNGQVNLALAALTLHVMVDACARRWWTVTLLLVAGLALKPLMAPLLLLVWVLYPALHWRVPLGLVAMMLAPLLIVDASYLLQQYATCITKLSMTSTPDRLFEDLRGMLAMFGWLMPHPIYLVVRALAALGVLWICWLGRQRVREPEFTLLLAALALGYLMVFNPRTLASSYVLTGALAGLLAEICFYEGRRRQALLFAGIALLWNVNRHWYGLGWIQYWLKPAACVAFLGLLIRDALAPPEHWKLAPAPQPPSP